MIIRRSQKNLLPLTGRIRHEPLIKAILFSILVYCSSSYAQDEKSSLLPDTLRLKDVIDEVIKNNDRLAAARYMEKAAYHEIAPAGSWDDPMLMLAVENLPTSFDFSEDPMTMRIVGLSQKIPYAGEKGLKKKAARASADAAQQETRGTEIELVTAARQAYYNLYYQRQSLGYVIAQRDIQNDILSSATARLRTDQANQADVAAAQADLWRLEADILSAQQDIETAEIDLQALMGRDSVTALSPLEEPKIDALSMTSDRWLSEAQTNYPGLQQLKYRSQNYRFQSSAANRMRWPMLELSGGYAFRSDPNDQAEDAMPRDNMVNFQVNLSIPIFSGRRQGNMARSMAAMGKSVDAEYEQKWRDIKSELLSLHNRAQRLSRSLALYSERIIPADLDAYQSAYASYAANRLPFANLLMYAVNVYRDRILANRIAYDLARTVAQAEQYMMKPDQWSSQQ